METSVPLPEELNQSLLEESDLLFQESNTKMQRVLLLVGPHKTASTSIQINMMNWLNDEYHPSGLAKTWAWPSPIQKFRNDGCTKHETMEHFVFYWWIHAMMGRKDVNCMHYSNGEEFYSRQQMIEIYRREFYDQWMKGYSLVIASEGMDFVGSPNVGLLEGIIHQLPWHANYSQSASGSDNDITVVVVYRSPRVDHLKSMWHQKSMRKGQTFHDYLTSPNLSLKSLDSLYISKQFLDRGLKVDLVDMAGVLKKGYDISNVVACDILGAACNKDKSFHSAENETAIIMNVKNNMEAASNVNVTTDKLDLIDEMILSYDCSLVSILQHPNITILHSHSIEQLLQTCQDCNKGGCIGSRTELEMKISAIVKG